MQLVTSESARTSGFGSSDFSHKYVKVTGKLGIRREGAVGPTYSDCTGKLGRVSSLAKHCRHKYPPAAHLFMIEGVSQPSIFTPDSTQQSGGRAGTLAQDVAVSSTLYMLQ